MTNNFAFPGDGDDDALVSSRRLVLLASVCSGILMCKIVYDLTGFISPLIFSAYGKLESKVRMEWNNRGFSTFHAIVVAVASIYILVISDQFDENVHGDLVINSTTRLSESVMGLSLGYFLADLAMIFWHFPTLGGIEYVFHHGLSMFSIILSVTSGQSQFYIFIVLFSEATTPFVNLRWYLDTSGQKGSKAYTVNGIALFLGWLLARVLLLDSHVPSFPSGEASVSIGILQPSYDTTGSGSDESHLVLENHQRIDQNNLQGETPGMKNPLENSVALKKDFDCIHFGLSMKKID